jgi:hypothetical protein
MATILTLSDCFYLSKWLRFVLSHPYRIGFVIVLNIAKEWTTKKRVNSNVGSIDAPSDVLMTASDPENNKTIVRNNLSLADS